jgi:hypothetical protein
MNYPAKPVGLHGAASVVTSVVFRGRGSLRTTYDRGDLQLDFLISPQFAARTAEN